MIDVAVLRHQPEVLEASLRRRGLDVDVAALADLDRRRREVRSSAEAIRAQQKEAGGSIRTLEGDAKQAAIAEAGRLSEQYKAQLAAADDLDAQFNAQWVELPNLTDETAADGLTDEDSVELKTWGTIPEIVDVKDHVDLGTDHGVLDVERAAKLSGSRFGFLMGPLVRLELALVQFCSRSSRATWVHPGRPARAGARAGALRHRLLPRRPRAGLCHRSG